MKKLLTTFITILVISSCSTTKEARSSRSKIRDEKNLAEQAVIQQTVESGRFIIRLEWLYVSYGGMIDLNPGTNYIIIDENKAVIRAGYLGRQYDIRPIAGINMRGEAINYKLTRMSSKGMYEIRTKIENKNNSFDLFLEIGKNGKCSASISSILIDHASYRGYIIPIKNKIPVTVKRGEVI
jgi:hypothetical protein